MSTDLKVQWWRPENSVRTQWWRPIPARTDDRPPADVAITPSGDSAVAFWALFAFTFILLISPQSYLPFLAPLRIALVTAGIALMALVLGRFTNHQPVLHWTRESKIALWLLCWAIATVPFSFWPGGSVSFIFGLYIKSLLVFLLLSQIINTVARLRWVAWGLTLMTVPLALTGIKNYLSGVYLQNVAANDTRIQGYDAPLTGNPNDLALTLCLILPLSIALFCASRKPMVRTALFAMIALQVVAIVATFSRGGFITLSVIAGVYLVLLCKRRGWGWAILALALLLAAAPFLPTTYINRIATITNIEADASGSAQERWTYMAAATKYTLTHPVVGTGVGMNMLALNEMKGPAWKEVHNVYLQYSMELGVPGLVLFLLLLRGCLKSVSDVRRRFAGQTNQQDLFYLADGIWVSLIAFAVAAMFYPVAYHFYFYYFAGLALAAKAIGDGLGGVAQSTDLAMQSFRGNAKNGKLRQS
jgi:putative inorganic carbon (hco3(-)) transporter